jgi:hypothetical protein
LSKSLFEQWMKQHVLKRVFVCKIKTHHKLCFTAVYFLYFPCSF